MDTTVTGIASVVVAELRAAGYLESTIGQYEKTIKALTSFVEERGGAYSPSLGAASGQGRPPSYCSPGCRQRAYRDRLRTCEI
ncbi:MAG: hypothetical protein M3083_02780 [Actinomycetota bacterium]|nr:hypothetical protein [Actinomycetota bacterium]